MWKKMMKVCGNKKSSGFFEISKFERFVLYNIRDSNVH